MNQTTRSIPQTNAKRKLTSLVHESLKYCLNEIKNFCLESEGPRSGAPTQWPSNEFLNRLTENIRRSASVYPRGRETIWDCVNVVENRRPSLKLQKRIEDLVKRAAKLYTVPRAIQIRNQGANGSEPSRKCFAALQKCYDGYSKIGSIDWDEHWAILAPSTAENESCRERATQICIEWLQWTIKVERPVAPLVFWLMQIGNPALIKRLGYLGSTDVFDNIRKESKDRKRKRNDATRQTIRRLKLKNSKLKEEIARKKNELAQMVGALLMKIRQEDPTGASKIEREPAVKRLIHYLKLTP